MTRILLVEDNAGDAVIFRETLDASELEYDLVHTKRLSEGLERLGHTEFDILMVDLSLPDAHGMEAVQRVRKAAPDLPLIVLTGLDDAAAAAEAKSIGAVDYLVKWYVDSTSLARYIRYAIAQYEMYEGGDKKGKAQEAAAPESLVVEGKVVRPVPREPVDQRTQSEPAGSAHKPVAGSPETEADSSSLLRRVAEAALSFVEQSERRSAWMADVLRSALDLQRIAAGEATVRFDVVNVLDLTRQVVTEQRSLAMHCGVPLHVSSDRTKVVVQADRNLVMLTLHRLIVDALRSADAEGVEVRVNVSGPNAVIETAWTENQASEEAADCVTLGRSVVEQAALYVNGEAKHQGDASGRHALTLRLPGPE